VTDSEGSEEESEEEFINEDGVKVKRKKKKTKKGIVFIFVRNTVILSTFCII
jgi:hypothetical protein